METDRNDTTLRAIQFLIGHSPLPGYPVLNRAESHRIFNCPAFVALTWVQFDIVSVAIPGQDSSQQQPGKWFALLTRV